MLRIKDEYDSSGFKHPETVFPNLPTGLTVTPNEIGRISYNASSLDLYRFDTDSSVLIAVTYEVIASGIADVENTLEILNSIDDDMNDYIQIIDDGTIVNSDFTHSVFFGTIEPASGGTSATAYDLWIGGVQFTSSNLTIDSSDDPEITAGTAVYDPENHKLTLTGFRYKGAGNTIDWLTAALFYTGTDNLTIEVSGENSLTESVADHESVGMYFLPSTGKITVTITIVLGNNPNYEIETVGAAFTITKASATITADDNSKVYGEADPTLTATVEGAVNNESLDYTLSRESGEDVGEYTISVELGNNPNYEISTVSGTFTIGTARIVIRAKDQNMILSAPLPRWNSDCYTVTGLMNGDTLDVEPSVRYLYNGVEVPAIRNIGTYEIVPYGAKAGNYAIVYEKGTLTVSYAPYDPADEPSYPPILQPTPGGTVTVDPKAPKAGETVTVTPKPDSGNTTAGVMVLDANGNPIQVTPGEDGKYRFTQPAGTATVRVSFERTQGEKNPFVDMFQSDYYYDPVLWAVKNGITAGTTPTTFGPNFACTRAQIVAFLFRYFGKK